MPSPRRAVIIGVDEYDDATITNLTGARNDAKEMHNHLTRYGGFTVEDHHFLFNGDATAANIRRAISDLLWKTEEADLSLLYFSGHGLTDSYGNGFIAPYDMVKDHPLVCGIRMQELRELMLAAKHKKTVLLILDCCYSGIAAEGDKAVSDPPSATVEGCLAPLDEQESGGSGRLILTSAGSDERSRELATLRHRLGSQGAHPHGILTFEILEGLDGRASREGGNVTLGSLIEFVNGEFARRTEQQPKLYGSALSYLDQIFLATASRQQKLEQRLKEIHNQLFGDDQGYLQLFRAIKGLEAVLGDSPSLEDALKLRSEIDKRLRPLRTDAVTVLLEHTLELSDGCQDTFYQLRDVINDRIDYETITQQEAAFRYLILCVFEVTVGLTDLKVLQSQVNAYHVKSLNKLNPSQPGALLPNMMRLYAWSQEMSPRSNARPRPWPPPATSKGR
jgi:uncharacterized caspase-like protein